MGYKNADGSLNAHAQKTIDTQEALVLISSILDTLRQKLFRFERLNTLLQPIRLQRGVMAVCA
ncbi:hypothetical protein C1884_11250 [Pseudomonas sp. GW460-R15]|nr:hypothetical protein C1887_14545 [Pseudomonas sp. GW456-R21]POA67965.1 hypothetical protein C1884_11250 [Pseudomonas sp. GW460-R15]